MSLNSKSTTGFIDMCRKVPINEVVDILVKIDTLLKTNRIHIIDLFNKDDNFDLRDKRTSKDVEELLYYNFKNFTYGEFTNWVNDNIDYFNKYMDRDAYNNVKINSRCFDTKLTILNTSKMLLNLLETLLETTKTGNIRVVFERVGELCNKTTYDKLLSNFKLSDHEYVSRVGDIKSAPVNFTLNISIDNVSIKISVEGFKDLFIYKASIQDFKIYFNDPVYQNNVMRRNKNDYIWINKVSLKNYRDDIMFMIDSVMFACHFPIIIDKKPIIPLYTLKSINVNGRPIFLFLPPQTDQVTPALRVNTTRKFNANANTNANSDINALKGMLPDIKWQSNVEINNSRSGIQTKFNSKANADPWSSLNEQLPTPRWKTKANANPWSSLNSLSGQLPNSRYPQPKVNANVNPWSSLNSLSGQLPPSRGFPQPRNSLNVQLPPPRGFPQVKAQVKAQAKDIININNSQVERWAKAKGMLDLDKFKRRKDGGPPMNNSEINKKLPTPRWSRNVRT